MPFCDMSCQIVSPIEIGATPSIARATLGCFEIAAARAKPPVQDRREEVEEADPEEPDEPLDAAVDPPVERADLLARHPAEVDRHQVADEPDAEVLVDLRAGVLDQVAAEDVHGLADEVGQADQPQVDQRRPARSRRAAEPALDARA